MHNKIETELEINIRYIESRFEGCADAVMRRILVGDEKLGMYVVYMDSMYDRDFIDGVVLKSLLFDRIQLPDQNAGQVIFNKYLATADVKETNQMEMLIDEVLKGNTAILIDGMAKAMIVSSKNLPGRGVSEAETEVSVRGSKESFTESFRVNTVLIRRRIRDTRLKSRQMTIGVRSKTDVALMYMEDLVRPEMLKQVIRKLESFKIDAILDSSYLESLTEEKWYSPFPQYQATERPDKAASAILEGRIVLVVDNSPMVLLLPTVFACFFQASDDYYDRWDAANFVRILRYAAAFFAVLLPGMYIALAGFHPEALPLSFALSFAASREGVPFTLPVEVVVMELEFQLPSGHIEIAGAGWVHMQIDTLLPHCRYMPATWLTDTVRQLLTAYMQHTNFRLHFKQMLLVIDEHSDVDGRHVFDQDNKGWKAVSNALKGLVIDDDDQYHLSVHMMSSRSAENVCHISLVLPESEEEFFRFHRKGIAYRPLEPSVALCPSTSFCLV